MSIPAILIGLAILLASIPIVAGPLLRKKRFKLQDEDRKSDGSQRSYEQSLLALRDLDFDHQLGVVDETDYQQLRARLLAEAAEASEQTSLDDGDLERLIETAVRDRRQHISNGHGKYAGCGTNIDPVDKYCTACGFQTRSACPHCEQLVEQGDRFCTFCGVQLEAVAGVVV